MSYAGTSSQFLNCCVSGTGPEIFFPYTIYKFNLRADALQEVPIASCSDDLIMGHSVPVLTAVLLRMLPERSLSAGLKAIFRPERQTTFGADPLPLYCIDN